MYPAYICIFLHESADDYITRVGRLFINGLGGLGSVPGHVIPNTLKIVVDTFLFNTLHYKVRIKDKVEQSRERSCALPYTIEKGAFRLPSTTVANFTYFTILSESLYGTIVNWKMYKISYLWIKGIYRIFLLCSVSTKSSFNHQQ